MPTYSFSDVKMFEGHFSTLFWPLQMALREWEHLLLVSFSDRTEQTWYASDQDRDLAAALLCPVFIIISKWHANDNESCLAAQLDLVEEVSCPALHVLLCLTDMLWVWKSDHVPPFEGQLKVMLPICTAGDGILAQADTS